jgi:hypothetical protein
VDRRRSFGIYSLAGTDSVDYDLHIVSVLESIVKDLETLPAPRLVEVAHYVSGLNPKRREVRLAAIEATAGCMSGEDGATFERLVREEADRVDTDDAQ